MRPGRITRVLFRAPIRLYAIGAGPLLGHRFLLLTHLGRRSGRTYQSMLEVLEWRPEEREAIVISGFGAGSQWYRNVLAGGAAEIEIGRARFRPEVRRLEPEEAAAVLAGYEHRNRILAPVIRRLLSRLTGIDYDGTAVARAHVVDRLPLIAFRQPVTPYVHGTAPHASSKPSVRGRDARVSVEPER